MCTLMESVYEFFKTNIEPPCDPSGPFLGIIYPKDSQAAHTPQGCCDDHKNQKIEPA